MRLERCDLCVTQRAEHSMCGTRVWKIYFILFYLPHNNNKKYRKRRKKKKWRGDLTETIGAYERLGLLELWARAVSHQLKKGRRKVEDGKIYKLFSYLLNNLIFSFFLKKERDWELMTLLSSELKDLIGPWKKGENVFVFVRQYGRPGNFLYCFERNCYYTLEVRMNFCKNT